MALTFQWLAGLSSSSCVYVLTKPKFRVFLPAGFLASEVPIAQKICFLGVGIRVPAAVNRREAGMPMGLSAPRPENMYCSVGSFKKGLPLLIPQRLTTAGPGWVHTARAGSGFILESHWEVKSQSIRGN